MDPSGHPECVILKLKYMLLLFKAAHLPEILHAKVEILYPSGIDFLLLPIKVSMLYGKMTCSFSKSQYTNNDRGIRKMRPSGPRGRRNATTIDYH